jgi:hypothetical protein
MSQIKINYVSDSPFDFNETISGKAQKMQANISCTATIPESSLELIEAAFEAATRQSIAELTMSAAMKNESVMELLCDGTTLKTAIEKNCIPMSGTIMIEDFRFDVTKESMDIYNNLKGGTQKENEATADRSAAPGSMAQIAAQAAITGAMMAQTINPGSEQSAVQSALKFCTNCGAKRSGSGRFCTECGVPF